MTESALKARTVVTMASAPSGGFPRGLATDRRMTESALVARTVVRMAAALSGGMGRGNCTGWGGGERVVWRAERSNDGYSPFKGVQGVGEMVTLYRTTTTTYCMPGLPGSLGT